MYVAALDLGTSSVKTIVMDAEGKVLGVGQEGYGVDTPRPHYAQQNPIIWWEAGSKTIREALGKAGVLGEEIQGIGFSGQMHGLVALDREGNLVCPAIIWMDQRSVEEAEEIQEVAGEILEEHRMNRMVPGMLLCSLLWIKKHQPQVYEKIHQVMLPKDYIRYKLTGEIGTDVADASGTGAFSIKEQTWCKPLLDKLGIREELFPKVHGCYEVAGKIIKEAAGETGLSTNTVAVYGAGDSAAQLVGNGVVREGVLSLNIGTASQMVAAMGNPLRDPKMRVQTFCHALPERWIFQGGALNGGSTLGWLRNQVLCDTRPFAELDREASLVEAGSEGLVFLPYLSGERTPYLDPKARGVFFGLSMKHGKGHLVRATMEGVVYNLRECLRIMEESGIHKAQIISSGGASKGITWKQIMADVFQMPIYTTATEEEACQGAAILALVGTGVYRDVEEACDKIVKLNQNPVEPIQGNFAVYKEMQERFREIYEGARPIFQKL